jgi:Fe-S cluster assembly protein SufD
MNTAAMQNLTERWVEQVSRLPSPDGPEWLNAARSGALEAFARSGLPHRKVEAWKYTPIKRLEAADPGLSGPPGSQPSARFDAPLLPDAEMIIDVVDGVLPETLPQSRRGVAVMPFASALDRFDDRLRSLVEKIDVAGPAQAFNALNTAYLHHGLVIHVGAGVDAGSVLLRWGFSDAAPGLLSAFRLFVLLDEGARIELVEQFASGEAPAGSLNLVAQLQLQEAAEMEHVRVQAGADESVLLASTQVEQAGKSRYAFRGFDLGGGLVRHELKTELAGAEARADLAGAWVLDARRHCDTHVAVEHAAPDCSSEQFFRGVLGGSSRGVFNGRALICEGADGSSVRQSNANLLLSGLAEMDTKPELEIYADEVEASHGATVGQLDETAVFYLRSRGLTEAEARRLLTAAFCHAVTGRVANRELAGKIGELVDAAMPEQS